MKYLLFTLWVSTIFMSCISGENRKRDTLYSSNEFTVYPDRVVQGNNTARVISSEEIQSNYKSPAADNFSRLVQYKFSINEKDNELPVGDNHWVIIQNGVEATDPIPFGAKPEKPAEAPLESLPTNYEFTFKLDARKVIESFEKQGFYETFDGTKVAQSDFKGFFLAGNSLPLSWDFVNLGNKGLQLTEGDEDGIFELTVILNPYDESVGETRVWKKSVDTSLKPQYSSDQPIVDALYNLSLEEAIRNIEEDSTLRTGAKWGGVWTRDISYSIFLAFAYHEPEIAKISLMKKVNRDRIIQDTGSGGAWPVSSDRTTWVMAAWEIYKVTGDQSWLDTIYPIIKNTLDDDYRTLYDHETGMFRGESSFLDWREQTYPRWMTNADIYHSVNLGTNVIHFRAHQVLASIAKIMGDQPGADLYEERSQMIRKGINDHLWMEGNGFYAQYSYGRNNRIVSPRFEALGEALAVMFGVSDRWKADRIISESPITPYGVTCIYPQIPQIPPYHNNGIWPFVQSYWNLAAAQVGNEEVLTHGLASIYRAAALFLSNYENFVAESGDYKGTEINSERMLWSMAGNLAMVHRVFIGMNFELDGILFNPVIPEAYKGSRSLTHFRYRKATLDITVEGYGNEISAFYLDDELMAENFFPADLEGEHTIRMVMNNARFISTGKNYRDNHFSLTTTSLTPSENGIQWKKVKGAMQYLVYRNGVLHTETKDLQITLDDSEHSYSEWMVTALDSLGYESFSGPPVISHSSEQLQYQLESFALNSELPFTGYSGEGFVEISKEKNRKLQVLVDVPTTGTYLLSIRYSNGSGPWNTDNNCAIRSLYANGEYRGVLVFPQRGLDEWSDWGISNHITVPLSKGQNTLIIQFDDWNENMDGEINTAMLDRVELIRVGD